MKKQLIYFALFWLVSGLNIAIGQVTISPTTLFIDGRSQFETFVVINGTNTAQEVSLEYQFGYPDADSLGNIFINYDDVRAKQYSIAQWLKGFPRHFIVEPGQKRVVRLTVRPDKNLEDGVYWARIKTRSSPVSADIGTPQNDGISTQITVQFEQVTAVLYKVGEVSTGINLKNMKIETAPSNAILYADLERTGNAPYLGTLSVSLYNEKNEMVGEITNLVSIYFDRKLQLQFDTTGLPTGEYRSDIRFESERSDISKRNLVQSEPVVHSVNFTIH